MIPLDEIKAFAKIGYNNGRAFTEEDFSEDFKLFSATKRSINAFLKSGKIEEKLLINNHIILINTFGKYKVNKVLRCMMNDVQFSVVKAILMFLGEYDYSLAQEVYPNRIMVDVLRDMTHRYNLGVIK